MEDRLERVELVPIFDRDGGKRRQLHLGFAQPGQEGIQRVLVAQGRQLGVLLDGGLHQLPGGLPVRGAETPAQPLPDDLIAKRMKGAHFHALDAAALEAVLHLLPGLCVEGQRQDPLGGDPLVEQVQDPVHQRLGLAGAGRGKHPDRSAERLDRPLLAWVQVRIHLIGGQGPVLDGFPDRPDAFFDIGFDLRAGEPADRVARQRQ